MKKITKIILLTITAIFTITFTSSTQASYQIIYQSTPNNYIKPSGNDFMVNIRKMETSGQVMGLNETQNSDLSPTTSNNIDVHLQKSTEYGVIMLLAASEEYGKKPDKNDATQYKESRFVGTGTTTGNIYGVYMNENGWTITAAAGSNCYRSFNEKYVNRYLNANTRFDGDAILTWQNSIVVNLGRGLCLSRGDGNGAFSCVGDCQDYLAGYYYGRASIVCGLGF